MAAAELCVGGGRIIDVGCDHGLLSIYLWQSGAERVIASDVRRGPLRRAAENIEKYGAEGVQLALGDGLRDFGQEDCDTVVICGMGGELIINILSAAPWTNSGSHKLVLQPMTRGDVLRRWLAGNGYIFQEERLVRDSGRLYAVMSLLGGGLPGHTHGLFSEKLTADPLFPEYVSSLREKYARAMRGKHQAGQDAGYEESMLSILKEVQ